MKIQQTSNPQTVQAALGPWANWVNDARLFQGIHPYCLPVLALLLGLALVFAAARPAAAQSGNLSNGGGLITTSGEYFSCALTSSGGVQCWGYGLYGRLGHGSAASSPAPANVTGLSSGVVAVDAGTDFACALTSSGGVKCWGRNNWGQLGNGATTDSLTPVDVTGLTSGVVAINLGRFHGCALTSGGTVKCWGSNDYGQLGDGTTTLRLSPVDATLFGSGVAAIAAGFERTCFVTNSGGAKCIGYNANGEFGNGTTTNSLTPVDVTGLTSGVVAISTQYTHSCAVMSSGGLKCWGRNGNGALGDGTTTARLTPVDVVGLSSGVAGVSAGREFTCALTSVGGVKCWGRDIGDQLGSGASGDRYTPTDVVGLGSGVVAVDADGVDGSHACAVTSAGAVKCWGYNTQGQLGTNDGRTWWVPANVSGLGSGGGALFVSGLSINKSLPSPYPPVAGQPVQYTIVVTNTSSGSLSNVTVTDLPGPGLGSMTAFTSNPAGSCNTSTRKCTLSSALAAGASATFHVTFNTGTTAGTVITNTAYVTATGVLLSIYPNGLPPVTPSVASTNLAITKTASVTSATPGTPYDYTVTVTNNGATTATNVKIKDKLPANVTYNSATPSAGGSCGAPSGGVLTCTWPSVAAGASVNVVINVTP